MHSLLHSKQSLRTWPYIITVMVIPSHVPTESSGNKDLKNIYGDYSNWNPWK